MKRYELRVVIILVCMFTTDARYGVCGDDWVFPDSQWAIPTSESNFRCNDGGSWRCGTKTTGDVCQEDCDSSLECNIPGTRKTSCVPPLAVSCVACHQDDNEATDLAYSFESSGTHYSTYDLLEEFGSFEYSKIYPKRNQHNRIAVITPVSNKAAFDIEWNDIMFNMGLNFWGVGKIELHHSGSMELGAMKSKVFAQLSAPYARLSVCDIETSNVNEGMRLWGPENVPREHKRGLVYEFQYRQRLAFTDPIQMHVRLLRDYTFLNQSEHQSLYKSKSVQLISTEKWDRFQGLIDFKETTNHELLTDDACIQLEFELTGYNEMLLDDLRVFANMFGDSKFNGGMGGDDGSNDVGGDYWSNDVGGDSIIVDGNVEIKGQHGIVQVTELQRTHDPGVKLAAMFSIQVKGNGTLHVLYHRPGQDIRDSIIYTVVTGSGSTQEEWRTIRVPTTMYVNEPGTDVHQFNIRNIGDGDTTLKIDNVYMYIDDRRCPVLQCDDWEKRVFVNGRCELCTDSLDGTRPCVGGKKQTGCVVDKSGIISNCTQDCTTPTTDDGQVVDGFTTGEWDESPEAEECTWICGQGFWFSRYGGVSGGPVCNTCTPIDTLRCNVGWYAVLCNEESDAKCVPCNVLDRYDSSVVYTIYNNYDTISYNETEATQCTHSCAPGQFKYAVRSDNGLPMCFPCTSSVCGAEDDGVSVLRMLDGPQYTRKCTATKDSQCHRCESDDTAVVFNGDGTKIGDWCSYQCAPGSKPCGTCQWDPAKVSTLLSNTTHVPFHQTLMLRLAGSATLNSAQYGTNFTIKVHISAHLDNTEIGNWYPPDGTDVVLLLFPVVPPPALADMQMDTDSSNSHGFTTIKDAPEQHFDVTVEARDFINTNSYSKWNNRVVIPGVRLLLVYEMNNLILHSETNNQTLHETTLTDFSIQTVNSTDGCCAARFADHTEAVDPTTLTRCLPCDRAQGLTGPLPANAQWSDPNDCSWTCNLLFEILPSGDGSICESCSNPLC